LLVEAAFEALGAEMPAMRVRRVAPTSRRLRRTETFDTEHLSSTAPPPSL
jgi:hypothetical protein